MGAAATAAAGLGMRTTYALLPLLFRFANIKAGTTYYQKQNGNNDQIGHGLLLVFQLPFANSKGKGSAGRIAIRLDGDSAGQLRIDVISAVLNGDGAAASSSGNHSDGLTAVAA